MKGAVVRNRLKRQLRGIVSSPGFQARSGLDLVIVIHPVKIPFPTELLAKELVHLCKRADLLA